MLINTELGDIEQYLEKNINELQKKIHVTEDFNVISSTEKVYSSRFEKYQFSFLKKECRGGLSVGTNSKNIIESIFFGTEEIIDQEFFLLLVGKYGEPSQMIKMGMVEKTEKVFEEDYYAETVIGEAVQCSFNENPINIVWEKENYRIHIKMNYQRNTSLINFELKI